MQTTIVQESNQFLVEIVIH